jgi:hypothetical protein
MVNDISINTLFKTIDREDLVSIVKNILREQNGITLISLAIEVVKRFKYSERNGALIYNNGRLIEFDSKILTYFLEIIKPWAGIKRYDDEIEKIVIWFKPEDITDEIKWRGLKLFEFERKWWELPYPEQIGLARVAFSQNPNTPEQFVSKLFGYPTCDRHLFSVIGKWVKVVKSTINDNSSPSNAGEFIKEKPPYYSIDIKELDWEILPPNWWKDPEFRKNIFSKFKNIEEARKFFERIDYVSSLYPMETFQSKFGERVVPYLAYVFGRCVVAECPLEGNAIYVIKDIDNWEDLLKLSKIELRNNHPEKYRKITHKGEWKERLLAEISR